MRSQADAGFCQLGAKQNPSALNMDKTEGEGEENRWWKHCVMLASVQWGEKQKTATPPANEETYVTRS